MTSSPYNRLVVVSFLKDVHTIRTHARSVEIGEFALSWIVPSKMLSHKEMGGVKMLNWRRGI